jgi:hypothetical protein
MYKIRNFHEGHSTVGEWQGRGRGPAWYVVQCSPLSHYMEGPKKQRTVITGVAIKTLVDGVGCSPSHCIFTKF